MCKSIIVSMVGLSVIDKTWRNRTKRQTREAIYTLFPNAGLQNRAGWLNEQIDKILSES